MYLCIKIYMYICKYSEINTYANMQSHMYICIFIFIYIYIYIYSNILI